MANPDTSRSIQKAKALFENLVSVRELQVLAAEWLRLPEPVKADTIYKWVKQGIPSEEIRGRRYFPVVEAATWLKRT
jgi:hypothetical protein